MFMQSMYKITAKVRWCRILHLVHEEDTPLAASNQKVKALVQVVYAVWGNSLYTKEKADCYIRFLYYYTIKFTNLDSASSFHSMSTVQTESDRGIDEIRMYECGP